jgi:hypothetical protein
VIFPVISCCILTGKEYTYPNNNATGNEMIKSFEEYTVKQAVSINGYRDITQWEKRCTDGGTATAVVDNRGVTRSMVREAFEAQEAGCDIGCFGKSDIGMWQR